MGKIEALERPRIRTGSDLLDLVVGGGEGPGYPGGHIINIVGDKSSGKTFLACEMIAQTRQDYKARLKWEYDDCESGFSFNTQALYGFEIMPRDIESRRRSKTVEQLYSNVREFLEGLEGDEFGIYVVDSLDGLSSDEMDDRSDERFKAFKAKKDFNQGSYQMGKPKFLSQEFFPQMAELIEKKNALLIIISQVRDNVDSFSFDKFTRAGGKAMDFYCHTVLWLAMMAKTVKRSRPVGVTIKARATKSKTPRPFRECLVTLLFDYGLDNIGSNLDYLFSLRTEEKADLSKTAQAIVWKGEPDTAENIKKFLEENELKTEYKTAVNSEFKKSEMVPWITGRPELFAKYQEKFGAPKTRDEMIAWIEENGISTELTKRVVEKWEEVENSIRSNRRPKYQPA